MTNCATCGKPATSAQCPDCAAAYAQQKRVTCPQCGTPTTNAKCGVCGRFVGKYADDGRAPLSLTLWEMSTAREWLDEDE